MNWEVVMTALQTLSIVTAILVALGTIKGRHNAQVEEFAEMKADLRYIKSKVEDIPQVRERLTIVEHEIDRAHSRIDDLKKDVDKIQDKMTGGCRNE